MSVQVIYVCSFCDGHFSIRNKSGKQGITFEDSERFGPSKVNMRTGELSMIGERSWFWSFYPAWVAAGRPVTGQEQNTPNGVIQFAIWPESQA